MLCLVFNIKVSGARPCLFSLPSFSILPRGVCVACILLLSNSLVFFLYLRISFSCYRERKCQYVGEGVLSHQYRYHKTGALQIQGLIMRPQTEVRLISCLINKS